MGHKTWGLALCPGVPDLALCPGTGLWPVRNQAKQQEVSGVQWLTRGQESKLGHDCSAP